jgi:hypothetical protein
MSSEIIDDEARELLRRSILKARHHLAHAEAALALDTPESPGHDAVWRNLAVASVTTRAAADAIAVRLVEASVQEEGTDYEHAI